MIELLKEDIVKLNAVLKQLQQISTGGQRRKRNQSFVLPDVSMAYRFGRDALRSD
jgi:hypothetical protein